MTVAVRASTLIDGTGADPVRGRFVVIDEGVITRIGKDAPQGAEVIDAGELTILPGLIDCHVHLAVNQESIQQRLLTPPSLNTAQAIANARTTLEAGFTTVRDAGFTPRGVKMAIERGMFPGPRMRIAVTPLTSVRPDLVLRDRVADVEAHLDRVKARFRMAERPAMNPIHTVDALVERCVALWRAGARGFILYFMAPFDHETIERVATEVRPKSEEAIA